MGTAWGCLRRSRRVAWFGGKRRVAPIVWQRFGDVQNYVEPFFGSGATLLCRPGWDWDTGEWGNGQNRIETVNDLDGFIANFWRALRADPGAVASYADWPTNEADLTARHIWLIRQRETLTSRLMADPDYYDAKIAGWWVWGICCWIGAGWCRGDGPWTEVDGKLVHLGNAGRGVNRQRVHLGDAGRGVNRQRVELYEWMEALAARLRHVRVCCGDWERVCGPTPTVILGLTGVFLDPPYAETERTADLYSVETDVSRRVREWAIGWGDDPRMRIALCGYEGEHDMPEGWAAYRWKAHGGYGTQGNGLGRANSEREVIWFSQHCLLSDDRQMLLWDANDE